MRRSRYAFFHYHHVCALIPALFILVLAFAGCTDEFYTTAADVFDSVIPNAGDNPDEAIGAPDATAVSLGGGYLVATMQSWFTDGSGDDLHIYTLPTSSDDGPVDVSLSSDGQNWVAVAAGLDTESAPGMLSIDISAHPGRYRYVKITDLTTDLSDSAAPGMEIDAIGALYPATPIDADDNETEPADGENYAGTLRVRFSLIQFGVDEQTEVTAAITDGVVEFETGVLSYSGTYEIPEQSRTTREGTLSIAPAGYLQDAGGTTRVVVDENTTGTEDYSMWVWNKDAQTWVIYPGMPIEKTFTWNDGLTFDLDTALQGGDTQGVDTPNGSFTWTLTLHEVTTP